MIAVDFFVGTKRSPEHRRHAEHVEEIGRHAQPLRGPPRFGERHARLLVAGDAAEAGFLLIEGEVVGRGEAAVLVLRRGAVEPHQVVGVRKWQRTQEQRVHEAEHRGVQADAERQREDRDEREAGLPAERAAACSAGPARSRSAAAGCGTPGGASGTVCAWRSVPRRSVSRPVFSSSPRIVAVAASGVAPPAISSCRRSSRCCESSSMIAASRAGVRRRLARRARRCGLSSHACSPP